jgi:deoxyribose-phosphate aldolase
MLTRDFLNKRFYASFIGPQFSDNDLAESLSACRTHHYFIAGIIVNLHQLPLAASILKNSGINLVGSVAYPLGNLPTELKAIQIEEAIKDGADEIHAVMKVEALLIEDVESARQDAEAIIKACGRTKPCALISNAAYLTERQAVQAAQIALELGAASMTNTGFGLVIKLDEVRLIREALGKDIQIIVAGGCRTAEQAINFLKAGANKIVTSTPFDIIQQLEGLLALQAVS